MTSYKAVGQFLKTKRVEQAFSQKHLAELLGNLNTQFVSNWERGLCSPPGHCLNDLIAALKIDKRELVEVMIQDSRQVIEHKVFGKKAKLKMAR